MVSPRDSADPSTPSVPVETVLTPQLALSRRFTQEAWARVETEFGLLTTSEVAAILEDTPTGHTLVSTKRAENEILAVLRGTEYRYPGFQFDKEHGTVLPVIAPLIELAHENEWRDEDLILWLQGPNTSFEKEDRPVDHLRSDPDLVLDAAQNQFPAQW
jgi:hypothetical protein